MANGTRVRDWATIDYYALLGIEPTADADEVTRAFREQAKRSHPDVTQEAAAARRFSDVTAAYAVLGDRQTRRAYDQVRAEQQARAATSVPPGVRPSPVTAPTVRKPWTRRRAWLVIVAGVIVTVLGIGAVVLTWSLHENDAHRRARYVPVTAVRSDDNGSSMVTFLTRSGERVRVREPQQHGDPSARGPTVDIRYDPSDPQHVIVDASTAARDITFAIIALKFLIGGPVFIALGARRLRARSGR